MAVPEKRPSAPCCFHGCAGFSSEERKLFVAYPAWQCRNNRGCGMEGACCCGGGGGGADATPNSCWCCGSLLLVGGDTPTGGAAESCAPPTLTRMLSDGVTRGTRSMRKSKISCSPTAACTSARCRVLRRLLSVCFQARSKSSLIMSSQAFVMTSGARPQS